MTRALISVARAVEVGAETDPDLPWIASCERHHTMVANATRALARASARAPAEWCEECRGKTQWREWRVEASSGGAWNLEAVHPDPVSAAAYADRLRTEFGASVRVVEETKEE